MFSLFKVVQSVSIAELEQNLMSKIKLIDVRTSEEYRRGHIAQAENIPLNEINTYRGKEKQLFVICQSGMRSKSAARILMKKGYDVKNIRGGMAQWSGKVRSGK